MFQVYCFVHCLEYSGLHKKLIYDLGVHKMEKFEKNCINNATTNKYLSLTEQPFYHHVSEEPHVFVCHWLIGVAVMCFRNCLKQP